MRVSPPGPVPLCFPSWWRRGAELIASPSSLSLKSIPPLPPLSPSSCAVMLVLPLPHHSVLRYSICYSSLHDSHDRPLFSTRLSSLLFPFLLCPCLRPPPYPQGTPCTLPAPPAISAALHSSLHCVGSLPLLHPCCSSNLNTHAA